MAKAKKIKVEDVSTVTVDENGAIENPEVQVEEAPEQVVGQITSNYGHGGRRSMEVTIGGTKHYLNPRTPKEMAYYQTLNWKMFVQVRRDSTGALFVPMTPYQKTVDALLIQNEVRNRLIVVKQLMVTAEGCELEDFTLEHAIEMVAPIMAAMQRDAAFVISDDHLVYDQLFGVEFDEEVEA